MARRPAAIPTQRVLFTGIADNATRNAVEELSRRLASVDANGQASVAKVQALNDALTKTVAQHEATIGSLKTQLQWTMQLAVAALPPKSKTPAPVGPNPNDPNVPPGTSPPSGTDNGLGAAGFAAPFPSGTAPPGSPITPFVAGQIVGGCATQFHALYFAGPAGSQAILDSWAACFINRVIFHLNAAGFQTSHYNPPSSNGYPYLILINIPANGQDNQYAYQIRNYDPTLTLTAMMVQAGTISVGVSTAPDPGIPDSTPCP